MASPSTTEIGPNLARLREAAGLKQAELASRLTMSAPSLSRVESGERPLGADELAPILSAIGTDEALRFSEYLGRDWEELPVPPLNHPKQDLLWEADQVSKQLRRLLDGDTKASFQKRVEEYLEQIRTTAGMLLKRDHTVAMIGTIGVGKSTSICRALGLEVSSEQGLPRTVLETGGGGITICEVHIYTGPGYGLIVEPCSEEEVRAHVMDFAEYMWRAAKGNPASADEEGESQGVSKEIDRAIRNLSGLQRNRRVATADGKTKRIDDAKVLAATYESPRDFAVEVLTRMALHKRDARNVWHDGLSGKAPLAWLGDTFLEINNGRHRDFGLPRRIELVVPFPLVSDTDLNIRFIDTKGIDGTAGRADLEAHLQDPHSLALLCSRFNDAPGTEARMLLTRAREAGKRDLDRNAALLVLPHPNEALKMKDDASELVASVEEGYELKGEQVEDNLESSGIHNIPICFFNAMEDARDVLVRFVLEQITRTRDFFSSDLERLVASVREVIANQAKEEAQAVLRDAASQLKNWVSHNKQAPKAGRQIQKSLIKELQNAHPSTVHAAVRREGDWMHLNYGYQLGHGARTLATATLGKKVADFAAISDNLRTNVDYSEAEALISQCEQVLQTAFDQLLRKMQVSGESLFAEEMKKDKNFWLQCEREWGMGPGYRDRVTNKSTDWFDDDEHENIADEIRNLLEVEWREALGRVEAMLQDV